MRQPRYHQDGDYKAYMQAYDEFFNKRLKIFNEGAPKLDSQLSERIAADYFDFDLDHENGFDGHNSSGESCEVKGTGYNNKRVMFTDKEQSVDHIYWVEAKKDDRKVMVKEITINKAAINKDGFISLTDKNVSVIRSETFEF